MMHSLWKTFRAVVEYCAECGWWTENCGHQK